MSHCGGYNRIDVTLLRFMAGAWGRCARGGVAGGAGGGRGGWGGGWWGRGAYGAGGDALAVQDRGDAALADAEALGAVVQAQPFVPVGGRYRTFVEVAAPASDRDALGGQELHDRRAGHAEH